MSDLSTLLETAIGVPFIPGNKVDVLHNGDEIFPAMLDAVGQAQHSIDMVTFVYWTGDIAKRFANALADRARAGVTVRVLLDAFGCKRMNDELIRTMEQAGVDIRWFRPIAQWKIWKWDNRTHRKILICDHCVAFTGGVGIAEEWTGDAANPSEWRDTHFRITGPVVSAMQSGFLTNWSEVNDTHAGELEQIKPPPAKGIANIQVIRSSSSIHWSDIALLFRLLITTSKKSLHITTAYFAPDQLMADHLCNASRRGVDIKLLVPGEHTDERLSQLSGEDHFRQLLDAGVDICQYHRTMLHAKILLVDDQLAVIGSANMNHRSMSKDEEFCLVIEDRATLDTLGSRFQDDLQHAEPLDIDSWKDRSAWQRTGEFLTRALRGEL